MRRVRRTPVAYLLLALAAVAALIVGLAVANSADHHKTEPSAAADRDAGEEHGDEPGEEGEEEEEDDGGPVAPAEYLTRKFTSGQEITTAQVRRGQAQAAALGRQGG